ncbi:MAG: glycosyltransferase family 2 protein [Patescibacteria group bacterium]
MKFSRVTIIIPVYNEKRTIRQVIDRSLVADTLGLEKEIIVVDNYSTDGTRDMLQKISGERKIKIILHNKNLGVGTSWRDGIAASSGEIILRQDADLEYMPEDFSLLLKPIIDGRASVVYGSRILGYSKSKYRYKAYLWGGILVNKLCNIIWGTHLTDILTAAKVFDRSILDKILLESAHFEIEAELTSKVVRAGFNIIEVPITYQARSFEEGKTIRWHHAFRILWAALKYRFVSLQ